MKKKLLSLVLALTMMLSMGTVAMADGAQTPTVPGGTVEAGNTVTIYKIYKAENEGTISPKEQFEFTYSSTYAETAADITAAPDITIEMEEAGSGKAEYKTEGESYTKLPIIVTLPEYTSVGVYRYTITETDNHYAGVTYLSNPITLVVTVTQDATTKKLKAAVHCEEEGTAKTDTFENTYSAGKLSIVKNVTGNMGDQSKYFDVTVTFSAPAEDTVNEDITITGGSYSDNVKTIGKGWNDTKEVPLKIRHNDTITFNNVPYGVTYSVTEKSYANDGYDAAVYSGTDITDETVTFDNGYTTSGTKEAPKNISFNEAAETVTIENHKEATVDTGINLDSMPYILILAAVAVGGVAIISKKRREEF